MSMNQLLRTVDLEIGHARVKLEALLKERTELAAKIELRNSRDAESSMLACIGERGCGGTGFVWGGVDPIRWAECIHCKGTGFIEGKPSGPNEIIVRVSDTKVKDSSETKTFTLKDFEDIKKPLLAHVMAKAEIFPSVSQARKNGWDKPLETGEWTVTKKKIHIIVVD